MLEWSRGQRGRRELYAAIVVYPLTATTVAPEGNETTRTARSTAWNRVTGGDANVGAEPPRYAGATSREVSKPPTTHRGHSGPHGCPDCAGCRRDADTPVVGNGGWKPAWGAWHPPKRPKDLVRAIQSIWRG